jgi:hypothetical protein
MAADLRRLAERSTLVASGTCADSRSFWDDARRFILTEVRFRPERLLKAPAGSAPEVKIRLLGGTVGETAMAASHAPSLVPGERVVLFLAPSASGDYHVITGGAAGKLSLDAAQSAARSPDGAIHSLDELAVLLGSVER